MIFGSPGETVEDMRATLDFIDFAIKEGVESLWAYVATPLPGTEFWEEAKKRGEISDNLDWEHDSALLSLYENYKNPPLADVSQDEFRKIFSEVRKKLRAMRIRIILKFFLSNPNKVMIQFLRNVPFYLNRIYVELFRA